MIYIFNDIYTLIKNALNAFDSEVGISSTYTNAPSKYPFVSVEEIDNMVNVDSSDSCHVENCALVQYEINVFAKDPLKKSKAYEILQVIDNLLASYNFVRMSKNDFQTTNETVYQIIARYEAIVSKDHTIYRR